MEDNRECFLAFLPEHDMVVATMRFQKDRRRTATYREPGVDWDDMPRIWQMVN